MRKKLEALETALMRRFSSMHVSVSASPIPNSPDYILASIRQLKTADFGPSEYVRFGRLVEWCVGQNVISERDSNDMAQF
jgi:hypothetical protein